MHAVRGLLMGGADIIPGVSGGTVALILGIYERLVAAISHFDLELLRLLSRRQWRAAAAHVDLRFLIALGCGVLTGIVSLASLMNRLLTDDETRPLTLAAFFGLILASAVLVAKMIRVKRNTDVPLLVILTVIGAIFAYWLTGQTPAAADEPSLLYVFLCGTVAICSMILPGISGAFILLILGMYEHITGILRKIKNLDAGGDELLTVAVFSVGCAVGLITFSKFLRRLLVRHEPQTMAVLCGFMLGSLRKIWPFKIEANPHVDVSLRHREFENTLPDVLDGRVLLIVGIALAAAAVVFALDRITRGHEHAPPLEDDPPQAND